LIGFVDVTLTDDDHEKTMTDGAEEHRARWSKTHNSPNTTMTLLHETADSFQNHIEA
jgi:hypothetical protein